MERVWIIIAGLCLIVAVIFMIRGNYDWTFVAATLGVVAWFISLRDRLRKTIVPVDEADEVEDTEDEVHNED